MNVKKGTFHSITSSNRPGFVMLNIATPIKDCPAKLIVPTHVQPAVVEALQHRLIPGAPVVYSTDFYGELMSLDVQWV